VVDLVATCAPLVQLTASTSAPINAAIGRTGAPG
jgi:hypothetical protein